MFNFSISHFVFRRQPAEFVTSYDIEKKNVKRQQVKSIHMMLKTPVVFIRFIKVNKTDHFHWFYLGFYYHMIFFSSYSNESRSSTTSCVSQVKSVPPSIAHWLKRYLNIIGSKCVIWDSKIIIHQSRVSSQRFLNFIRNIEWKKGMFFLNSNKLKWNIGYQTDIVSF